MIRLITVTWCIVSITALVWFSDYDWRAGESLQPVNGWPTSSQLQRKADQQTLLLFLHPMCPCSRSSVLEFADLLRDADILSDTNRPVDIQVVLLHSTTHPEWDESAVARLAKAIPHANIVADNDGVEAARFAVTTSGTAMLFSPKGALQFSGGLTPRRGHQGTNAGRESLDQLLNAQPGNQSQSAVFGCPLHADQPESVDDGRITR